MRRRWRWILLVLAVFLVLAWVYVRTHPLVFMESHVHCILWAEFHCRMPFRLVAPLGREVWLVGHERRFVRETEWPEFARQQVELLVEEGFDRQEAERLLESKPE